MARRTAALTPISGSPFTVTTDGEVCSGLSFPTQRLLIALNRDTAASNIQVMRKAGNGTLRVLGVAQNSIDHAPSTGGVDPSGRFLGVADDAAESVRTFILNRRTGQLKPAGHLPQSLGRVNTVLFIRR